jgi:hypothetical protein
MEDVHAPHEAIVAEADELTDAPDEETVVGKVTFHDISIT